MRCMSDLITAAVRGGATGPKMATEVGDRMITQLRSLLVALSGSRYSKRLAVLAAGIVQRLSVEEHQRLAFARLLLHRPRWVVLDDALSAPDEEHRQCMLSFFEHELVDTAVVSIGRSPARNGFYDRTLYFHRLGAGATLVPLRPRPRPAPQRPRHCRSVASADLPAA
jgi:ABC-type uncharacterized transport system fused permease/ATPase subunit